MGDREGVCLVALVLPINVCGRPSLLLWAPVLHSPTDPLWIGSGGGGGAEAAYLPLFPQARFMFV